MLDDTKPKLAVEVDEKDHAKGAPDAAVTLVEYGDYECPSCASAVKILDGLLDDFDGKLRVIFRHFPMYSVHPVAGVAAQAAEAAGAQGRFWDMHRELFKAGMNIVDIDVTRLAIRLELDVYKFENEMMNRVHEQRVAAMVESGEASGVAGTPALFLNGTRYVGSVHALNIRNDIERLLETAS